MIHSIVICLKIKEGMEDIGVRDVLMKKDIKMDANAKSN